MSLIDTKLHYLPLNRANRYELTPLIDTRWHNVTLIDTHIRYHAYVRVVGTSCNSWSQHAFCSEVRRPHHFVACIEPGTHIEAPSPSKPNGMFWSRDISVQAICPIFWNTEFAVRASVLLHDSFDSSCFLMCVLELVTYHFFLPWDFIFPGLRLRVVPSSKNALGGLTPSVLLVRLQGVWALYIHGRRNESWSQSILLAIWVCLLPFLGFGILSWLKFNL